MADTQQQPATLSEFAGLCRLLAATAKKLEKRALMAAYLGSLAVEDAARAALYLAGSPFAETDARKLQVGGATLARAIAQLSGAGHEAMHEAWRRHGDLGEAALELLRDTLGPSALMLSDLDAAFTALALARGPAAKLGLLLELLARATPLEAKYIVKLASGDMRIGVKQSLVEEAVAVAAHAEPAEVRRAIMLNGSLAEAVHSAFTGTLGQARMRLFHPLGFMLASPVASVDEALARFAEEIALESAAQLEDKYDGIRAQLHAGDPADPGRVGLFSRNREDLSTSFPELIEAFAHFPRAVILDGEILAWQPAEDAEPGRALPFAALQQRLGRKRVTREMRTATPVVFMAFDLLYLAPCEAPDQAPDQAPKQAPKQAPDQSPNGVVEQSADLLPELLPELLLDRPLAERRALLEALVQAHASGTDGRDHIPILPEQGTLFAEPPTEPAFPRLLLAPAVPFTGAAQLDSAYYEARARGNEGVMLKASASLYQPGRRGLAWLKLKRELATLDVVITGAEFGHGRRAGVLSDYTFAVRDEGGAGLLNVGKAYSGLTDAEIDALSRQLHEQTLEDTGSFRTVVPTVVLEVAFNNVMRSSRHTSGFALRFPRILRLRPDKPVDEIDTLARVQAIYASQPDKVPDKVVEE